MTTHKQVLRTEEALTLALKDLKWVDNWLCEKPMSECVTKLRKALTAIKEALISVSDGAQPKQERCENCGEFGVCCQPKQEPVAWMRHDGQRVTTASDRQNYPDYETRYSIPLYTTPPYVPTERQRTWVGLTDDEIMVVLGDFPFYASEWFEDDYYRFARAIEAAHGIRPTDFKE